jgi:hypothetical protein
MQPDPSHWEIECTVISVALLIDWLNLEWSFNVTLFAYKQKQLTAYIHPWSFYVAYIAKWKTVGIAWYPSLEKHSTYKVVWKALP